MGFLRGIFGPNKEEVWRQLSREIGAEFVDGGFWKGDKVVAQVEEWTITLDTYTQSSGKHSTTYTRMRAPFANEDGVRFTIYRKGLFSGLGKLLGMQDVEVGYAEFDRDFIIKGNDESKVQALFANSRIRELIEAQPSIRLRVKDDELYFQVVGVIKDVERLKSLYALFAMTLNQLCHMDAAYEDDPNLVL